MHSCSTTADSYECHELRYTHCLTLLKSAPCTMQQAGNHRASKIVPQEPRRLKEARINISVGRGCADTSGLGPLDYNPRIAAASRRSGSLMPEAGQQTSGVCQADVSSLVPGA